MLPLVDVGGRWLSVRDGDPRAVALYERHYSARAYADARRGRELRRRCGISGVGESMVLLTVDCLALFVWQRSTAPRYDAQSGVQCSVFRCEIPPETGVRASDLIMEAEQLAWTRWPGERLWTYVDADKIRSTNPGYCFKVVGWVVCGVSKGGLVILEKLPTEVC
jgi:hypothetical protein